MKKTSLRGSVTYCSVLALSMAAFAAGSAFAQEASTQEASTQASADKATDDAASEATEVVVTGTRIRHKGAASATPTTVINAETIRKTGTRQIADLVNQMPALVISQSDQTSNANRDKDSLDPASLL